MKNLLNIIFVIIAVFLLVKSCNRIREVNSWPETKGVITSYVVQEYRDSESYTDRNGNRRTRWEDEFRIKFKYRFQVEGSEYTGQFEIDDLDDDRAINRKLRLYPKGKKVRIKYDPNNPYDSEFKR